jgi:hypothetical protein
MGSTQDVSWNKPFGDSTAATLLGGNGGISSIFNGVSMTDPIGTDSFMGQASHGNKSAPLTPEGKDKQTGEQVIIPGTQNITDTATGLPSESPQFGGGFPGNPTNTGGGLIPAPPDTYAPPMALTALNRGANTGPEDSLRASYLQALKPNYGFTFQGETNPNNAFNAVPGAKGR